VGICVRIWAGADGDDGKGDAVDVGDQSPRSTQTSRLATSTVASKLLQT